MLHYSDLMDFNSICTAHIYPQHRAHMPLVPVMTELTVHLSESSECPPGNNSVCTEGKYKIQLLTS